MKYSGLSVQQIERLQRAIQSTPFVLLMGIQLDAAEPGAASMSLPVRDELMRNNGVLHGGATASLIDTCAAFAVIPLLAEDEFSVTADLTISYLRPLRRGMARASAKVLRQGSRVTVLSIEVTDTDEKLTATALTTHLTLKKN